MLPSITSKSPKFALNSDWLGVPLRNGKKIIGALVVQNAAGSRRYVEGE